MAALRIIVAAWTLLGSAPVAAESVGDWRPYILQASLRFAVPTVWIERVMQAESAGRTTFAGRPIRSRAGAIGLMQLMPATWETLRQTLGLGANPDDPRDNIFAGTCYLRMLYERFGYPGLLAAYNAGPARYADHLVTGRALPAETIAYLAKVGIPATRSPPLLPATHETLFAIVDRAPSTPIDSAVTPSPASLFAVKRKGP